MLHSVFYHYMFKSVAILSEVMCGIVAVQDILISIQKLVNCVIKLQFVESSLI